ncbi:hyaluronan-binding protein 2-like [Aricia agestis]|uniref:hyaluronan-binding protein 2-like n=1 Tax=Aricia agestis TaxID=91739 RepID=UPI001C208889|nr:hyaluronan-binding protein 2-like [Aricia agestis]
MRLQAALVIFAYCAHVVAPACSPQEMTTGCKIAGNVCSCGYGCSSEFIFRTRRACLDNMKERSSNICNSLPCMRGNCLQTQQDPGYLCKCEGTGYYGQRCEKACPTAPVRGLVFPHECIVI